jgi:hypothetical protein
LHDDEERRDVPGMVQKTAEEMSARTEKVDNDPFKVSTMNGGPIPMRLVQGFYCCSNSNRYYISRVSAAASETIINDAYDRFREKIKKALEMTMEAEKNPKDTKKLEAATLARERAYDYLMRHDKFSMRDYLQSVE